MIVPVLSARWRAVRLDIFKYGGRNKNVKRPRLFEKDPFRQIFHTNQMCYFLWQIKLKVKQINKAEKELLELENAKVNVELKIVIKKKEPNENIIVADRRDC